ncbi:hypothetical protein H072_2911 [Dactylellina haptotyla CBS 200.50]|uniref:Uncharacterized protein n=1 Tax=Dactylellina haptotyla (strain CBS 200.50) TaxID=1284197 RepID=S8C5V5_DACHA|nr:hypothetical protein H072_2911 [Dactylellina haptotyla CBS 200.50]
MKRLIRQALYTSDQNRSILLPISQSIIAAIRDDERQWIQRCDPGLQLRRPRIYSVSPCHPRPGEEVLPVNREHGARKTRRISDEYFARMVQKARPQYEEAIIVPAKVHLRFVPSVVVEGMGRVVPNPGTLAAIEPGLRHLAYPFQGGNAWDYQFQAVNQVKFLGGAAASMHLSEPNSPSCPAVGFKSL